MNDVTEAVVEKVVDVNKLSKEEILDLCKEKGIEIAEETAVSTVRKAFDIIEALAPRVSIGVGAMIPALRSIIEPPILAVLDKIDGKDNPNY